MDKVLRRRPSASLRDLVRGMYLLPETRLAAEACDQPLEIAIGRPNAPAAHTAFVHGALSVPEAEIVRCYWCHGIPTVMALHATFDDLERLRQDGGGRPCATAGWTWIASAVSWTWAASRCPPTADN